MSGRIDIVRADITTLEVDAVVNAANQALLPGGGVCGAIHRAAGPELAVAARARAPCPPGEARITPGFGLAAPWVVHAVGPVWRGGVEGEPALLAAAYRSALQCAAERGLQSIAFPCISTGIFGYPRAAAARVAVETVREFLQTHPRPQRVLLCAFGEEDETVLRAALAES